MHYVYIYDVVTTAERFIQPTQCSEPENINKLPESDIRNPSTPPIATQTVQMQLRADLSIYMLC